MAFDIGLPMSRVEGHFNRMKANLSDHTLLSLSPNTVYDVNPESAWTTITVILLTIFKAMIDNWELVYMHIWEVFTEVTFYDIVQFSRGIKITL